MEDIKESAGYDGHYNYNSLVNSIVPNAELLGFTVYDFEDASLGSGGSFEDALEKRSEELLLPDSLQGDGLLSIPFQYIETVPVWSKGGNYSDVSIKGRFESVSIYANSNAQDFNLVLNYNAEGTNARHPDVIWTIEYITELKKRLQSFMFPQYDEKYSPPKKVLMNIGDIYTSVPCVIKNVICEELPPYIGRFNGVNKKITVELRTSYPLSQAISQSDVYASATSDKIFAHISER